RETGNGNDKGAVESVNNHKLIKYFNRPENGDSYKNMEGFRDTNLHNEVYKEIRALGLKNKLFMQYTLYLVVENGIARPAYCVLYAHDNDSIGINEINKLKEVFMKTWFYGIATIEDDGKRTYNVQSGLVWWGGTLTPRHTGFVPSPIKK
ncbi:MAG: hypothetical protein LBB62_05055, partial [Proteiniphilum sp.]|nr:hypothetical protein [Proteiniphilum sp.]